MKKILMVVALLGFGMMIGCGEEPKPNKPKDTKSTVTAPSDTGKPAPAADTTKKP